MSTVKIRSLTTTATTTASDDFLVIDGTTNSTRKLSAATPAFLTSVTVPTVATAAGVNLNLATGTAASDKVLIPGTLEATAADGLAASIGTLGGASVKKALWVGGIINVAGHTTFEGVTSTGATGTGKLVYDTSPSLTTPALGTPSTLIGTNISGTAASLTAGNVTTNANLTGDVTSVGNATSIAAGVIVNADINASAAIVDTKLDTIATALKVSNSATTAASANTASAIVARDASGNFSAGTVSAALTGNASTATALATGRTIAITGDLAYTSPSFDGSGNVTAAGTLASVASAGTSGGSTAIPVVTINAKGLTTSITTAAVIAPAGTLTGSTLASGVTASSLTSLGTIGSLVVTAGTISGTPSASTDIANKLYVDTVAQGLDAKASCIAATTADITLSGTQTIDGISVIAADRVLVKNQTLSQNNGIYLCASGAWTRTTDADTWDELISAFTFIETGTVNADTGYVCTVNAGGTLGTTALPWSQFSGAGSYTASTGLTLTGTVFSLTAPVTVALGGTNATSAGIAAFNNISGFTAAGATGTTSTNLVFSTSPSLTSPTITSGILNGTLGATTPSTIAATSIAASLPLTFSGTTVGSSSAMWVGSDSVGGVFINAPSGQSVRIGAANTSYGIFSAAYGLAVTGTSTATGALVSSGANLVNAAAKVVLSYEGSSASYLQAYGTNNATAGTLSIRTQSADASVSAIPAIFSTTGAAITGTLSVQPSGTTNPVGFGATNAYGVLSFNNAFTTNTTIGIQGGGGVDKTMYYVVPTGGGHSHYVAGSLISAISSTGAAITGTLSATGNATIAGTLQINASGSGTDILNATTTAASMGLYGGNAYNAGAAINVYGSTHATLANVTTFSNGGFTERMRIDSSGNVGIGTASPSYKLDVSGVGNFQGLRVGSNGDTIDGSTGLLAFQTSGTERMRINSSGNVGIGTASPSVKLQVQCAAAGTSGVFTDATNSTLKIDHSVASKVKFLDGANTEMMSLASGAVAVTGTLSATSTITSTSGNLTSTAAGGGALHLNGTNSSAQPYIYFERSSSGVWNMGLSSDASANFIIGNGYGGGNCILIAPSGAITTSNSLSVTGALSVTSTLSTTPAASANTVQVSGGSFVTVVALPAGWGTVHVAVAENGTTNVGYYQVDFVNGTGIAIQAKTGTTAGASTAQLTFQLSGSNLQARGVNATYPPATVKYWIVTGTF